jgi:hypothetical protein
VSVNAAKKFEFQGILTPKKGFDKRLFFFITNSEKLVVQSGGMW